MTTYIIRRLVQAIFILIIVTVLVFIGMRVLPGDPIVLYLSEDEAAQFSDEEIATLKHEFGLDKPLAAQYFDWMSGVVVGDLGVSIFFGTPVSDEIARSLPRTLHLGLMAFLISILIGIPAGVICAVRRGRWVDTVVTLFSNMGITVPIFWLGILLIYLFGLKLRILPIQGYTSPFEDFWLSTKQSIMPIFCLSIFAIASAARQTRSSMLEVTRQDYIRTAWSKGLTERTITIIHALKNGLIPVITLKGITLRNIVGGSVLVETVFNVPGMGRLVVDAIFSHDYAIVQGVILVIAVVVTLGNLAVDLSYGWLDPRVRYG